MRSSSVASHTEARRHGGTERSSIEPACPPRSYGPACTSTTRPTATRPSRASRPKRHPVSNAGSAGLPSATFVSHRTSGRPGIRTTDRTLASLYPEDSRSVTVPPETERSSLQTCGSLRPVISTTSSPARSAPDASSSNSTSRGRALLRGVFRRTGATGTNRCFRPCRDASRAKYSRPTHLGFVSKVSASSFSQCWDARKGPEPTAVLRRGSDVFVSSSTRTAPSRSPLTDLQPRQVFIRCT